MMQAELLAETLVDDFDLIEFLRMLTSRTSELFEVSAAGLLLADHRGQLRMMAASDERAEMLELFQVQTDEGPCHDCYHQGTPVVDADLTEAADRWPRFAPRAADTRIVQAVADIATIALLQERAIHRGAIQTEQLQTALQSRIVIEQAKGALAQIHSIDLDQAFEMLRSYARAHNQRLGDVSYWVTADPE